MTDIVGVNARDLFPDLFPDATKKKTDGNVVLPPPPPPDISWLATGSKDTGANQTTELPRALVVVLNDQIRVIGQQILAKMGYVVDTPPSGEQALQNLHGTQYHIILCEAAPALNEVHRHISGLASAPRRKIHYTIIGSHLHTLYNLEALAFSANLVVNNRDLHNLEYILRKGLHDYEALFGPLLECLNDNSALR